MTFKKMIEHDRKLFEKLRRFQLPNHWKRVGYWVVAIVFGLMIAKRFVDEPSWVKPLLNNLFLMGLLIVSISKEKIEDERIAALRSQSYGIAFITGVFYAFVQPYVGYLVELVIRPEEANADMSYFQVLVFMLVVQLMFFRQLKRSCI